MMNYNGKTLTLQAQDHSQLDSCRVAGQKVPLITQAVCRTWGNQDRIQTISYLKKFGINEIIQFRHENNVLRQKT